MAPALHCLKPSGTNHPVILHHIPDRDLNCTAAKASTLTNTASVEFTLVHKVTTHSVQILREEIFHITTIEI
jgi:hypothetical protein